MGNSVTARLFDHDHRQAVELPEDFRLPGAEVRLTRVGAGVLIEPVEGPAAMGDELDIWLDRIHALTAGQFPEAETLEPELPADEISLDDDAGK